MKKSIIFIFSYILLALLLPIFLKPLFTSKLSIMLYNLLTYAFLSGLGIFIWKKYLINMCQHLIHRPVHLVLNMIFYMIGIFVVSTLLVLFVKNMPVSKNQQSVNQILELSSVTIFFIVLLGPFVEELIFRHFMIGEMSQHVSVKLLAPISVICFGLIHLKSFSVQGFLGIINYFVIGLFVTVAYLKNNKNLAYPLGVHVLNNLISVLLTVLR